jgi:hypothetical protein
MRVDDLAIVMGVTGGAPLPVDEEAVVDDQVGSLHGVPFYVEY